MRERKRTKIDNSLTPPEFSPEAISVDSVTEIVDSLWEAGAPMSVHVTIIKAGRRFKIGKTKSREETRGYWIFNAFRQQDENGTVTKSVLITPDNQFTTVAVEDCMLKSGPYGFGPSAHRNENITPVYAGDDNEGTITINADSLQPLSELPEPRQVLGRLAIEANDRLSVRLGWHIAINDDHSVKINRGSISYM